MSLHQLAQQIQSHGRGNDSQLVHMTPGEVRAMRKLAQRHGGDLSINPRTGLPEAGFLENLLPTVVGAGVGIMTGNPFIGAAAGGALGMAANKGSIQSGLMAGLGAYGMGSLGAGLMSTGAEALAASPEAMAGALGVEGAGAGAGSQAAMLAEQAAPFGAQGLESVRSAAGTAVGATPSAAPSAFDKLQAGFQNTKFDMDFLKKNMFPIGMAAAPLLMSSSSAGQNQQGSGSTGNIRPYKYSQTVNPRAGEPGQPYFIQSYTPQEVVPASEWGSRSMADGGLAGLANNGRFLGDNPIYPMSHINRSQYATSSQMPNSAAMRASDYDTPTMPYSGQEVTRMAEGGETDEPSYTEADRWRFLNEGINPLPAMAPMPLAQPAQQPVYPGYVAPPVIQPTLAQLQERYINPQRTAPLQFVFAQPTAGTYVPANMGVGYNPVDYSKLINPVTGVKPGTPAKIIADKKAKEEAAKKEREEASSGGYRPPGDSGGGGGDVGSSGPSAADAEAAAAADAEDAAIGQAMADAEAAAAADAAIGDVADADDAALGQAMADAEAAANAEAPGDQGDPAGDSPGGSDGSDGGSDGSGEGWNTGGLLHYAQGGGIEDLLRRYAAMQQNMYAQGGGIYNLGSYSDGGRLLKGPGDGVSDDIPAQIGRRQPARLADGEFVIPARIVSELGNGSTDAGAKRLYAMMDRVQQNRKKSVGKNKVAVDSKAYKHLPA